MDTKTNMPFTPSWRVGDDDAPKFYFRRGSVIERSAAEAELSGEHQAGRVFMFEIINAVRAGVMALLADDPELDRVLELIDREKDGDETIDPAGRQVLLGVKSVLAEHWPEYRELLARKARRQEIAPVLMFRRFCTGWEKVGAPFAKGMDGFVTDDALAAVDPLELIAAGNHCYGLQYDTGPKANFPQPSPSDAAPATSNSGDGSREGGESTATTGQKTPATPSPSGSSE